MTKLDSQAAIKSPFVLVPEVVTLTGCPRSTILKYSKLGLFPPIVILVGNRIAFVRSQVQRWLDVRLADAIEAANDEK